MAQITTIDALEALYDDAVPAALTKVAKRMTPMYRQWIDMSKFVVLSTVGPEGTDASPRGDDGPVLSIVDDVTLHLPDWRGNNRLDSLRNIVRDGRVSLMFMVPGCNNVVRINGSAILSIDPELTSSFSKKGKTPRSVIIVSIQEMYFQCAKAIMRSQLWSGIDQSGLVPTAGDFVSEVKSDFDGHAYDVGYAEYAKPRMW
ncbi:pyridoxamine 5'-phosphate oxidase family protein [Roseobacter sp.]|uniref:pyridoxamine 5'-phosphate oxidase family protein n=1 Tax=Roseobacter sp. TaxID=1907202 RepID=UPI0038587A51